MDQSHAVSSGYVRIGCLESGNGESFSVPLIPCTGSGDSRIVYTLLQDQPPESDKKNKLAERHLIYTTRFEKEKIEVSNRNEQQQFEWSFVHRVFRYKEYFYLYITRSRAFILPGNGLGDSTLADDFWNYAQQMTMEGQCKSCK